GDTRVSGRLANCRQHAATGAGIWLQRLVAGSLELAPAQGNGHQLQRRSTGADHETGGLLVSAPQAHDEREAQRSGISESCDQAAPYQKKAIDDDADFALIFQDEMEIHRHPALTRMWAPVGKQPAVPAPGQNEKKVVYGGVDYKTGKLTYTVTDTKSGAEFLAFLAVLGGPLIRLQNCLGVGKRPVSHDKGRATMVDAAPRSN